MFAVRLRLLKISLASPALPIAVGPFMVELFTGRAFNPVPGAVRPPVSPVARQKLPTPAALNELAYESPDPADGILTRFVC